MNEEQVATVVVMHVVDRLTGGVPVAVRDYIRNSPAGITHVILSPWNGGERDAVWEGVSASHVDLGASRIWQPLRTHRILRRVAPDVVHAHSSFPGVFVRLARTRSVRVVYSPHCFKFDDPTASSTLRRLVRAAERLLARRTDVFAVLSAHEARLAESLGAEARVARVPNTPSVPRRRAAAEGVNRRRIGMVGRLAPQKDPAMLIDLVRELSSAATSCEAVWIGGGDDDWTRRLREAGVRVTGWLPAESVTAELDELSVYVHTASYEGFPLSVLDAAARGVPVVARRIPALDEVGLTTFEDAQTGAALIRRVLNDPDFSMQVTQRDEGMLARMNAETQLAALEKIWR